MINFVNICIEVLSHRVGTPNGLHFEIPFGMYILLDSKLLPTSINCPSLTCFFHTLNIIERFLFIQLLSTCWSAAIKNVLEVNTLFSIPSLSFPPCLLCQSLLSIWTIYLLAFLFPHGFISDLLHSLTFTPTFSQSSSHFPLITLYSLTSGMNETPNSFLKKDFQAFHPFSFVGTIPLL